MQNKQQPSMLEIVGALLVMFGFLHVTGVLGKSGGVFTLAFDVLSIVVGAVIVAVARSRRAKQKPPERPMRKRASH